MDKSKIVAGIFVAYLVGMSYLAFNAHNSANASKQEAIKLQEKLDTESRKSVDLINETGKGVVYLAPKGALAKKDDNASYVTQILNKTFVYSSPDKFKTQAEWVKPRVSGEFYNYWFKNGIGTNYDAMVAEANGRAYKRFMKNMTLTQYSKNHYFAVLETGVLEGGAKESDITPVIFGLDITYKNGKWNFERVPGFYNNDNDDTSQSVEE